MVSPGRRGVVLSVVGLAAVPTVEQRVVTGVPRGAQSGRGEIPGAADLTRDVSEVTPQLARRRPAPKSVAVVDTMDDQARRQHEGVGDHRVVIRVGVLLDVEVALDD